MIGEEQFGQKRRYVALPVSPRPSYVFSGPWTFIAGFGTATITLNADPDPFWQVVQWHTPVKMGSASPE